MLENGYKKDIAWPLNSKNSSPMKGDHSQINNGKGKARGSPGLGRAACQRRFLGNGVERTESQLVSHITHLDYFLIIEL